MGGISRKSVLTFLYINGFLISLSFLMSLSIFEGSYLSFLFRNYLLIFFINYGTRNKKRIVLTKVKQNFFSDNIHVFSSTLVEYLSYLVKFKVRQECPWIHFIPALFQIELILDFFHYLSHRLLHHPLLYKWIHKQHHYHTNPTCINTFYHNPMDLFLTIEVPMLISFYFNFYSFTSFQKNIVLVYKTFIEISGHSGKQVYPNSSFPLCIWLPKFLGIQLYTEDHSLHHSETNCNYSKRFSIWDRLFGTYKGTDKGNLT